MYCSILVDLFDLSSIMLLLGYSEFQNGFVSTFDLPMILVKVHQNEMNNFYHEINIGPELPIK